jgi:YebC/PmpR family DNA-binding regulatory protein
MSGHSKWATTKHQKGVKDKARGKLFAKLIRQVEVAAREGGGDIKANATLRTMFQKARDSSVPMDTIERAIKRGTGELEGVRYEAVSYEGYAPSGVAVIVECLTDNRNRTGAEIRAAFSHNGGSMAEPGAVSWQFERKGVVTVPRSVSEDDLMAIVLDAGAEDLRDEGEIWMLVSDPSSLQPLSEARSRLPRSRSTRPRFRCCRPRPSDHDESTAKKVLRLLELFEDHDDVQNVYANFDIPDDVFEAALA